MEVKTSFEIETRFKCKIEVNIQNIDQHYKVEENLPYLAKRYDYRINYKSGRNFLGHLLLADQKKRKSIYLVVRKDQIDGLIINYDLMFNGKESISGSANGRKWRFNNNNYDDQGLEINPLEIMVDKIESCKGWFEIDFKPCPQIARKREFKIMLHDDTFPSNTKNLDFTVLCQDESFQFSKSKLCFVSDVFQKMIETPGTQESQSGVVEIPDFSPEVIEAFNRIMFENAESLDEKDLTVDLLMFANKYCIISLIKMITNHLRKNLTIENICPIIKGAYLMDNDELLMEASRFINNNPGKFQDNEDWQQLEESHPKCFAKMMKFIMFQKWENLLN